MPPFLANLGRFFKRENSGSLAIAAAILASTIYFGGVVNAHYPIKEWLFWHYFLIWIATLAFGAASFATGLTLLERVIKVRLPLIEHAMFAFALGVLAFQWCLFLIGAARGFRTPTFFLLPIALFTLGFEPFREFFRRVREVRRRVPPSRSLLRLVCIAFGCAGLAMIYFSILTPDNVQFDSLWKHMALAEDYVAHRGIRKSTEGWIFAARPHLTSYLYSWAFLMPGARLFDHMVLGAHLEFFTFLLTTVLGISAVVRRLVPHADPSAVWAARFLFPGVFLYDSSLSGGTDHFGAMYAPVIALALFRALRALDLRFVAMVATFLAGTVLVKETAALLLLPFPILALVVRAGMELVKRARKQPTALPSRRLWLAPALGVGVMLLVSIPLWLKNLVLYGDPLYPNLARFFPADPWSDIAAYRFKWAYAERLMWSPSRDLDGLIATLKAMFTYSFIPNDWARSHGKVPVFGSLFTLLLIALPFLKRAGRIWLLVVWIHLGIFAWYSVHHQDRYLQGIVPLMAAVVAAILVAVWRSFGPVARVATSLLVGLQVVWGGDVYFIQTHAMIRSPIKKVVDLLSSGYEGKYDERFETQGRFQAIGKHLGKRSRVLIHELHPHLGLGAESALDSYQWQFGIEYGAQGTPEGIRKMLRELGITHVYYTPGKGNGVPSLASEVLFHEFVTYYARDRTRVPGGVLVSVPEDPATRPYRDDVLVLTCKALPVSGLYKTLTLDRFEYGPDGEKFGPPAKPAKDRYDALRYAPEVDWVVIERGCYRRGEPKELADFEVMVKRKRDKREFWRRKEAEPPVREEAPEKAGDAAAEDDVGNQPSE